MGQDEDSELLLLCAALQRALKDRDAVEELLRSRGDEPWIRTLSMAACEQVLARRTAVQRCLIRQGWRPPRGTLRHLVEDEALLAEPLGAAGG